MLIKLIIVESARYSAFLTEAGKKSRPDSRQLTATKNSRRESKSKDLFFYTDTSSPTALLHQKSLFGEEKSLATQLQTLNTEEVDFYLNKLIFSKQLEQMNPLKFFIRS